VYPPYANFCRVWNTNHITRDNLSLVLMLPWPNIIVDGQMMPTLIDNLSGSSTPDRPRNRMWVVAE
jgi:hypothetical protein